MRALSNQQAKWLWLLVAFGLLLAVRLYTLPAVGLLDFDSVRNWQVVQEIRSGNFRNLFLHRSPSLYLLFAGLSPFLPNFHWYAYLNAAFSAAAVTIMANEVRKRVPMSWVSFLLLALAAGCSVFMVHSGRYFSIESLGLLAFAFGLRAYLLRTEKGETRFLYQALTWLAFAITVNYKALLLIPIFLILEFWQPKRLLSVSVFLKSLAILLLPFLIFSLVAVLAGLPWWRYAGSLGGIFQFSEPNAAHRTGKFRGDPLYYFRYLFQFESPLSWLGMAAASAWAFFSFQHKQRPPVTLHTVLSVICLAFLLGMMVLNKAPRGLIFCYVPLYLLGYLQLRRITESEDIQQLMLAFSVLYSLFRCHGEIYSLARSEYADAARYLRQHHITKVVTTVGNGLLPYAQGLDVKVAVWPGDLEKFRKQGYRHLLVDQYFRVTNLKHFEPYSQVPAIATFREFPLRSRLLYLEHSEFTGLGYSQTLRLHHHALAQPAEMRLVHLP
jgi:hypothetical protein